MSNVDSVHHIAAAISSAVARTSAPVGGGRVELRHAKAIPKQRLELEDHVVRRIQSQIAAIDPDDRSREGVVLRTFLEAVLIAELGERLLLDPAFFALVDRVEESISGDPVLASHAKAVVAALLKA